MPNEKTLEPGRRRGDIFRRRLVHQRVHLAGLRDVPVLAELAREIAAGGAKREYRRARVEVVERLLFDRIDAKLGRAPVRREHDPVAFALAHEAGAALAFMQPAVAGAKIALDAAVVETMPPPAGVVERPPGNRVRHPVGSIG